MKDVKHPKWDEQVQNKRILFCPDGPSRNASPEQPLEVGNQSLGTIGGVEIGLRLVPILSPDSAEAEIIIIQDGAETTGDLHIGDVVSIKRDEMKWLDVG